MGPMTGRAAGYCAGYSMPGFANPIGGRGMGMGWGGGRGFGRGMAWGRRGGWRRWGVPYDPGGGCVPYAGAPMVEPTPDQERSVLESQMKALRDQMDAIGRRLETLAKESQS